MCLLQLTANLLTRLWVCVCECAKVCNAVCALPVSSIADFP